MLPSLPNKKRLRIFATDFDGTLSNDGRLSKSVARDLQQLTLAGFDLVLVSGRSIERLEDEEVNLKLFARIVAEDGATIFEPASGHEKLLARCPPDALIDDLRALDIKPLKLGRCIISTERKHEKIVAKLLKSRHPKFGILLDKNSISILPLGVNKHTGLQEALRMLRASSSETAAAGDAENDMDLLKSSAFPIAVADAIPEVKQAAAMVTRLGAGKCLPEIKARLMALRKPGQA
jgi:hydroxymethylpyrimidine pyrophosphatase-like HAD family hydrolase